MINPQEMIDCLDKVLSQLNHERNETCLDLVVYALDDEIELLSFIRQRYVDQTAKDESITESA